MAGGQNLLSPGFDGWAESNATLALILEENGSQGDEVRAGNNRSFCRHFLHRANSDWTGRTNCPPGSPDHAA